MDVKALRHFRANWMEHPQRDDYWRHGSVVEDLVKLLDGIGEGLRHGRYPSRSHGKKIAAVLRRVADDLDA